MGTRLYIGNLSFRASDDDVRALLSEGGRVVKDLHLPSDRETGRPRGFAFAEMGSEADAQSAIQELDGLEFQGRNLRVNEAQERPPRPGGFGGGGWSSHRRGGGSGGWGGFGGGFGGGGGWSGGGGGGFGGGGGWSGGGGGFGGGGASGRW